MIYFRNMKNALRRLLPLTVIGSVLSSLLGAAPAFAAGPLIGGVTPMNATSGVAAMLSASVSSSAGIKYCHLYVDLEDVGDMTVAGGMASKSFTFSSGGSRVAFVFCKDNNDGIAAGPNTAIWVSGAIVTQPPLGGGSTPPAPTPTPTPTPAAPQGPAAGSLIKLVCAAGAGPDDACKAVYYVGKDGKRHAFPNSKVYFSWYANFDSVTDVTTQVMGSFMLGKNVTYRPGSKMVKFQTLNNVYAVSKGGVLRWVASEATAIGLYGTDWNTRVDDIPDTFYGNYTFGSDIADAQGFNVTSQLNAAPTIDDSL